MRCLTLMCLTCAAIALAAFRPVQAVEVALGDPSLTAGVPGDGELTLAQLEPWLSNPENHQSLQVKLPEGLAVGQDAVYIPADNPLTRAKIELGRQLYFDRRMSKGNEVSCADCHHPDYGYAFPTQFGVGIQGLTGDRNSPTAMNRLLSREQFWDGRAADLEAQAIGPIANPIEMGNTHETCVEHVSSNPVYRAQFRRSSVDRRPSKMWDGPSPASSASL